jgi:hypothetical protein
MGDDSLCSYRPAGNLVYFQIRVMREGIAPVLQCRLQGNGAHLSVTFEAFRLPGRRAAVPG